ncbi:MAG: sulfotransferase [Acidobacteria bacterium]|jgi:3-oxoacyl-(acyl-carrier-protein) synthase|nr:sulfotransferase [Acidobacteriota bacterium]
MQSPNQETWSGLEIAVIGMAGKFPGAGNIDEFWQNLKNGVDSISFFSDEELLEAGTDPQLLNHPHFVKACGVLGDETVASFDADFFGYMPQEADLLDPQMRQFLQCTWLALENAGYNPETYEGLIGLFCGAANNLLWETSAYLNPKQDAHEDLSLSFLVDKNYLSTLVSYKLNLKGPAVMLQTACSTSLVAIHYACRSLLNGECDIALAGGVTVRIPQKKGYIYQENMLFSSDAHCRAFDAQAQGMIDGNGIGIVVLKKLAYAVEDGDEIQAIIKGSAINNDGKRKVGYTAPSVEGQAAVIKAAVEMAEVDTENIGYIEAHGTATPLGDTIEIAALTSAFNTKKRNYCAVGSVKTNIGHLDAAAGVAGFIKTVLVLKYKQIPPSLYFETPNSMHNLINTPFYVNVTLKEMNREKSPLRAGVSSFGIGGTNAHIILEEWIPEPIELAGHSHIDHAGENHLILLSAKTNGALNRVKENLAGYLKKNIAVNLADVAYTLHAGRKSFECRWMTVCAAVAETIEELTSTGGGETHVVLPGAAGKIVENTVAIHSMDKHSLMQLGRLWLQGMQIDPAIFYAGEKRRRISLPGYPFEVRLFKENIVKLNEILKARFTGTLTIFPPANNPAGEPVKIHKYQRPQLKTEYAPPTNNMEKQLVEIWEELFAVAPIGIHDNFFELGGNSLKGITFVNRYREMLGEIVQVPIVFEAPSITELTLYFKKHYPEAAVRIIGIEMNPAAGPLDNIKPLLPAEIAGVRQLLDEPFHEQEQELQGPKNRQAIFILSAPRTGSTLLRVMLAGHPELFAGPELNLLEFSHLLQRRQAFPDSAQTFLQGTIRAIMEIKNCSLETAAQMMQEFETRQMTTKAFFHLLQEWLGQRRIVDKSTAYALNPSVFQRMEAYFEQPLYIHLLRHPYGMIRSYEEARMDLFLDPQIRERFPFTRRQWAELTWTICNQNILDFLKQVPGERQFTITFEQLVQQPEAISTRMCDFLGLKFDPGMISPYEEKKKRMTDGIYKEGMMVGDMKFHEHKEISADTAETWSKHYQVDFLSDATWMIAEHYGYRRIETGNKLRHINKDPRQLLKQLDQLSDTEIDSLIREKLISS